MYMKNTIIALLVLGAVGVGVYVFITKSDDPVVPKTITEETASINPATSTNQITATSTPSVEQDKTKTTIGSSLKNNTITAYHFGSGPTELLFVGGIHGGYEWNTSLVAYELIDYLTANPSKIPKNVRVTVIPVVNPDGLEKVTGSTGRFTADDVSKSESIVVAGRYNENNVDLNRNFDCDWQKNAVWQTKTVSGGNAAFSEPESKAIRDYVTKNKPSAVVVWYSAGGGVFASSCHNGVSKETNTLTQIFASASSYAAHQSFDFYATTGDMVNWLAKNNIPAISVLLTDHTGTDWSKNKAGIDAVLKHFAQ